MSVGAATTPVTRSRSVVMLILLALSYATNAMDRQVFPILLPTIDKHFNFALSQGGLLSTVFGLGIAVTGIPIGYLLDRWSRRSVILVGTAIFSIGTLLTAFSVSFGDMFFYRIISGVGEGLQNAALYSAVGAFYSNYGRRTTAIGAIGVGYAVGSFVGPTWGAAMGVSSGWATPFIVYGIIGLVLGAAILLGVSSAFTEQKELRLPAQTAVPSQVPESVWNHNMIVGIVVAVVMAVAEYGYLGLYPAFLIQGLHFPPKVAGFCISMFGIGGLVALVAGWLGDLLRQKRMILYALIAAAISGYLMFNSIALPWEQALFAFLEGVFASAFLYNNVYALMQRSVRPEFVGRASGIFVTFFYVASGLAGYLFASLVHATSWGTAGLIQLTLLPIIAIVAILFTREEELIPA